MNPWGTVFECFNSAWIDELNEQLDQQLPELGVPRPCPGLAPPPRVLWEQTYGVLFPMKLESPQYHRLAHSCAMLLEIPRGKIETSFLDRLIQQNTFQSRFQATLELKKITAVFDDIKTWKPGSQYSAPLELPQKPQVTVWSPFQVNIDKNSVSHFWLGVCG